MSRPNQEQFRLGENDGSTIDTVDDLSMIDF